MCRLTEWARCGVVGVLGSFELWDGLLESFFDYPLKELGCSL